MKKVEIRKFTHAEVDAKEETFGFLKIPSRHELIRAEVREKIRGMSKTGFRVGNKIYGISDLGEVEQKYFIGYNEAINDIIKVLRGE